MNIADVLLHLRLGRVTRSGDLLEYLRKERPKMSRASMFRTISLCLIALIASAQAQASFVDMFNGVKVGAPLPKSDLIFLSSAPSTTKSVQLIDFWATTCEPCRTSIPKLNAFHQKYAPKGLVMIGVSDESKEQVATFLKAVPMQYATAIEGASSLHKILRIRALPYAIFVNRDGVVIWRGQPEEITDQLIEFFLAL